MTAFIALLKSFIFLVSSSLLYPVLFFLSLLLCWIVVQAGALFSDWIARRRRRNVDSAVLLESLASGSEPVLPSPWVEAFFRSLTHIVSGHPDGGKDRLQEELATSALLEEQAHLLNKSLDRLKVVIRIGPGLGLIGTLIPMGTGLSALGQGDIARLSADLVVAFTTTVVGLFVGMAAYFFFTIRRRWVERDIMHMELIAEFLSQDREERRALVPAPGRSGAGEKKAGVLR